jgi:hypothetical protein
MNKMKILVAYHKKADTYKDDIYTPIHVGKALSSSDLSFSGDDTGDNISKKNPNYCELTGLYWAWKNNVFSDSDYIGFCHYRRYFVIDAQPGFCERLFEKIKRKVQGELVNRFSLDNEIKQFHQWLDKQEFDVLLPFPIRYNKTIKRQYSENHYGEHLDIIREIITEQSPQVLDSFDFIMDQNELSFANMFIMKKKYFDEYMKWVFDILFELEKRIEIPKDPYQARIFGFLSERLLNVYTNYIKYRDNIKVIHSKVLELKFDIKHSEKSSVIGNRIREGQYNFDISYLVNKDVYLNGWAFTKNKSSENEKKYIELYNDKKIYCFTANNNLRDDITLWQNDGINYDDCGIFALINAEEVEKGNYNIKILSNKVNGELFEIKCKEKVYIK